MSDSPRPRGTTVLGWMRRIAVIALLLGAVSWFIRAAGEAREAARRSDCHGNLFSLAIALHNYHASYGSFPPAVTYGPDGTPWHSWRALILNSSDYGLSQPYRMDEPWDGPNNRRLIGQMPLLFACPTSQDTSDRPLRHTNYVAIVGPGTCFPPDGTVRLDDITDGPLRTLLLAEMPDSTIPWTAPVDLDASALVDEVAHPRSWPHHLGRNMLGRNMALAGVRIRWISSSIDPGTLRALTTISGGEPVPSDLLGE